MLVSILLKRSPMILVISHRSALQFWRRFAGNRAALPLVDNPQPMANVLALSCKLRVELASCGFAPSPQTPLDLLFSSGATRSRAKSIRAHSTGRTLPPGSLLRLSEHLLIVSPELVFLQIAGSHSFEQLIMAGCELCGTYVLLGPDGRPLPKPIRRPQLTSTERIAATATSLHLSESAKPIRALHYVFDAAASPMEAKAALLLSLPARWGGYNLPRPVLNAPFKLSREATALYPRRSCRLDLYWANVCLDVEYDGEDSHTGDAHAKDVARIAALTLDGIDVMVLAKAQVYNARSFASIAEVIARKLGVSLRIRAKDFAEKQRKLREELGLL